MAAIKFSKQYVDPNPNEVDYWIDLTSNPYGGRIKYNNGIDWVDLIGSNGSAVDFDNYFNKDQINEMLANKASVDSVEQKVDDTEIAEIIKNIEIKDRGNSGVELVLLKYDDTTIGVTMPIASSTTSGVVTSDDFKNLVKQYKLQEFYTEMYEKLADIRSKYQLKLTAGNNIVIDKINNTISVVDDLKVDWDRVRSKPNFHEVSVSGDYWDLKNKLTAGIGIEIDKENKINAVPEVELYEIVDALPTKDINTNKIYILLVQSTDTNNVYIEYIYIDDEWKELRTFKTNVDLKKVLSKE